MRKYWLELTSLLLGAAMFFLDVPRNNWIGGFFLFLALCILVYHWRSGRFEPPILLEPSCGQVRVYLPVKNEGSAQECSAHIIIESVRNIDHKYNVSWHPLQWESGEEKKTLTAGTTENLLIATLHGPEQDRPTYEMKLRKHGAEGSEILDETSWTIKSKRRPSYKVLVALTARKTGKRFKTYWLYPEPRTGGLSMTESPPSDLFGEDMGAEDKGKVSSDSGGAGLNDRVRGRVEPIRYPAEPRMRWRRFPENRTPEPLRNSDRHTWVRKKAQSGPLTHSAGHFPTIRFEEDDDFLTNVPVPINHELCGSVVETRFGPHLANIGEHVVRLYNKGLALSTAAKYCADASRAELIKGEIETWFREMSSVVSSELSKEAAELILGAEAGTVRELAERRLEQLKKLIVLRVERFKNVQESPITLESGIVLKPGQEIFSDALSTEERQSLLNLGAIKNV